jgi:hypothetical protein
MSRMPSRRTRRSLRPLRGGGTASYGFTGVPEFSRTVNNPILHSINSSSGASTHIQPPHMGGGIPGLSTGAGPSLQKGGGGGTHYGFSQGGGLFGGVTSIPTNCAVAQSGGAGQLNVPQNAMGGGRRNRKQRNTRNTRNTRKNKSRRNKQSRRR